MTGRAEHRARTHTTNYVDTFITVAPDASAEAGTVPPTKPGASPSVAARTYELIASAPYEHTSDDVVFTVWADRRDVPEREREAAREEFFSKGQPCLRSSDLAKRYGWGIHSDAQGRVAVYGVDSPEYQALSSGRSPFDGAPVTVTPAMRSARR